MLLHMTHYPRADKSWLVVKPEMIAVAREIFAGSDVKVTSEWHKYLGGYLGTVEGKENYARAIVEYWISQIVKLSEIARSEPDSAYTDFATGMQHKFTYHIRALSGIK